MTRLARRIAGALALGILPLSALGATVATADATAGASSAQAAKRAPSIHLKALPPIAQAGVAPAASSRGSLISARFKPLSTGQVATLQTLTAAGTWQTVTTTTVDGLGYANFTGAANGHYRVVGAGAVSKTVKAKLRRPAFRDEFSGTRLNARKWATYNIGYNKGGLRTCAKPGAAYSVADGTVRLGIRKDPRKLGKVCRYRTRKGMANAPWLLNTQLTTVGKFEFKYGVVAARVKFQPARGSHVGTWIQSLRYRKPNRPATGVELDYGEYFGRGGQVDALGAFLYMSGPNMRTMKLGGLMPRTNRLIPPGHTWWNSYHVVSAEWRKSGYTLRIDGRVFWKTKKWVSRSWQYLVLSNLSSDYELKYLTPQSFAEPAHVDWVRVWTRKAYVR
ncbi:MAG: glycoside hydrolase family 16 protein [Nocardioides sp.]|jgi:hypothetical protein